MGLYDKCFRKWLSYYENISNSFCPSFKKLQVVKNFLTNYYSICNSVLKFKKNLFYFKNYQQSNSHNPNHSYAINKTNNLSCTNNDNYNKFEGNFNKNGKTYPYYSNTNDSESQNDLKNFFEDFQTLYKYKPNLKSNYVEYYEYYRALIHMNINSK